MKTIKELAIAIGVSRVSLYNMIKREEFKKYVFKGENNTTLIDEVGEQLLKAYYLKEQGETFKDMVDESVEYDKSFKADSKATCKDNNADLILILQAQLKEKDEQIKALLNIVANQQKLQGAQLLVDNNTEQTTNAEPVSSPNKGFWQRLFNI